MGGRESEILNSQAPKACGAPLGLYVHLPFCASRCAYCDFHSLVFDHELAGPLLQAIKYQLRSLTTLYNIGRRSLDTIFLGGGTPSLWPAADLAALLDNIAKYLPISKNCEITLEANPDSLSLAKVRDLRLAGYNRLSLGVQSFNGQSLKVLGRRHQPGQIYSVIDWARMAGFTNLSLDIIYGLPFQQSQDAARDVSRALELAPQHLSLYQLTLSPETRLGRQYRPLQKPMPAEDTILAMEEQALALCQQAGLRQYEVSNYALPGFSCRHNCATWQGGDYLALGPGAHGHLGEQRWANFYDLPAYIAAWQPGGGQGVEFCEILTPAQRAAEIFMLGLRTTVGVDLRQINVVLGRPPLPAYERGIEFLQQQGWAKLCGNYLRPTRSGLKMADRAALEFI